MAITNTKNTTRGNNATQQLADELNNIPVQPQSSGGKGLNSFRGRFHGASSRSLTSETIKNYMDAINECRKTSPNPDSFSITTLDSTIMQTLISGLVVSFSTPLSSGKELITAHVLLLEATVGRLPTRQIQAGNQTIELPCVPGDAFNEGVRQKVIRSLQSIHPGADIRVTGAMVIPTEVSHKDAAMMQRFWGYTAEACAATANMVSGYSLRDVFTVADFLETDRFYARIDQNVKGVTSAGIPVRSDLAVNVYGVSGQNSNDPFNTNQVPICTVDTYTDLVYRPLQPAPGALQQPTQCYVPVVNISKISSELGEENLEIRLLAIASATVLAQHYAWATPLNPRLNRDNLDLRDIGSLSYEVPALADGKQGVKIDTRSSQFDDMRFAELLKHTVVGNELYFRLVLEDTGEMSWLDSIFHQAAQQGERGTKALRAIVAAANRLTNNKFNNHYKGGAIVYDEQTRIPLGYYNDGRNGGVAVPAPITNIGYLELLTILGGTDLKFVTEYDTFTGNREIPMDQRYSKTLEMLDRVLQGNFTLKGVAYPVLLDNDFLKALCTALMEASWSIQPSNINLNFAIAEPRGISRFTQYGGGFNGSDVKDMFQSNTSNNAGLGRGNNSGLRWGVMAM